MEKGLKDKLDLFTDLSEEERAKVEDKFMPDLAYIEYDELERALSFLRSQNVYITKAREVKVMTLENFVQKFDILNEVNATDLYSQNPEALIWDALDLFKKIKYCVQSKHDYKNPDGTYKSFLFDTKEWGKEFSKDEPEEIKVEEPTINAEVKPVDVTLETPEDLRRYDEVMAANQDLEDISNGINRYEDIKANLENSEPTVDESYDRRRVQEELGLDSLDDMTDTLDSTPLDYNSNMYGMQNDNYTPINSSDEEFISFNDAIPLNINDVLSNSNEEFDVNAGMGRRR